MNWASGLDPEGRPIYEPAAFDDKTGEAFISIPGAAGAHSWQPCRFLRRR
jgi:alcohol dehydrogenase (cytochrome c)/quinohemoprotein ethanol dehydrogenase